MTETLPKLDDQTDPGPRDAIGHFLFRWSQLSVLGGIALLLAACGVSVYSVVGRWLFNEPVLGDVEFVQFATALAIAACLPYAQMKNAHVIVDFFTHGASPSVRATLDRIAAIILMVVSAVLAWRSFAGALEATRTGEESMILGWPLWWSYITLGPGFALLSLTAAYTAWKGKIGRAHV